MFELELSRCPICQTQRGLNRQMRDVKGQHFIWYECPECGSALMWMGGDRWVYQHIGRPDRQYLLRRPLTTVELQALSAASAPPMAAPSFPREEAPAKAEPDWYRQEAPAKAEPDWYRQEAPAQAEPDWHDEEVPAEEKPDWLRELEQAKTEPAHYPDAPQPATPSAYFRDAPQAYLRDEPPATNIRDQLPADSLYAYEPEPVAPIPEPEPAPVQPAARPTGLPKSLLIAVVAIAFLCLIAAVLIVLTQG